VEHEEEHDGNDDARPAFGDARAVALRFAVPSELDGLRADVALAWKVRRLSRTRARAIIERGDLRTLADVALKPSSRVVAAQDLVLWRIPPDEPVDEGVAAPRVIVDREDLLVVDKPGDLAVHPSARYLHRTLTAWLRERARSGEPLAHPCHRLDRETSGVLVCARGRDAERCVKSAFMRGEVRKVYVAVARGTIETPVVVDAPLALQGTRGLVRIRMLVDALGQPSVTEFFPLFVDEARARTVVACVPRTGRQHQIRAHLAHIGHAIVGDKLYAMGDAWFDAYTRGDADVSALEHARHALHAARLVLDDGERFSALVPEDLRALIDAGDDVWTRVESALDGLC